MILITGATGLVGRFIANDLLDDGVSFKALKRADSIIPEILENHIKKHLIKWVDGDLKDPFSLQDVFDEIDIVIHSAALISFYKGDYLQMWETNVQGTINLLHIALEKKVKKFVHLSSIAALGRGEDNTWIDEETQWYKSVNNSYYAETKYMAELEAWRSHEEGLPLVVLNPSTVLGPTNWNTSSTRLFKYVWDEKNFYPTGYLNYVDVRDVSSVVIKMVNTDTIGERFILNGGKTGYHPLFQSIARHFEKKAPSWLVKPWMLTIVSFFEWLKSILTGVRPIVTPETVRLIRLNNNYKNDKIKSFLDFEFKPLEDTIVWTCQELTSQKTLK